MEFEKEQAWRRLMNTGEYDTYYCHANNEERELFRTWAKSLLRSQAVLIEFVKANGDIRVMECTLSETLGAKYPTQLPVEAEVSKQKPPKKVNEDVCAVWDLKQGAWRSFRWDRVKRIDFKIG